MIQDAFPEAQALYEAGDFQRSRELALQGLNQNPGDVRFLRLAGRTSMELGRKDASGYFRALLDREPDDVGAWQELGEALIDEGDLAGAAEALRQVNRWRPDEHEVLFDLAHVEYALGQPIEAISLLSRLALREPDNIKYLRSLVEMYLRAGYREEALRASTRITALEPDDLQALVDIADLNLTLGNYDDASVGYRRLRSADTEAGHEVYAYHGMIEAEMRRGHWRRAFDLALDATRIDRYDLTTQVLAFTAAKVLGPSPHPTPTWEELEAALAAERAEHRRMHMETLLSQ